MSKSDAHYMADEEEVVETDTAAEEDADAETEEESSEEDADGSSSQEETDWEKVASDEKKRADDLEKKLADKRFKQREAARKTREESGEESEEEDDYNRPLTKGELRDILAADRQEQQKESQESAALEIARKNTSSEAEAKAAVLFYKGRVVPTGNLEEDVLFAIAGMNRKRIKGQQSEVRRANRSQESASDDAASGHQDVPKAGEPKLAPQDAQAIKAAGFVWEGSSRLYKKPLGKDGKKTLFYDPKTKRRWAA